MLRMKWNIKFLRDDNEYEEIHKILMWYKRSRNWYYIVISPSLTAKTWLSNFRYYYVKLGCQYFYMAYDLRSWCVRLPFKPFSSYVHI